MQYHGNISSIFSSDSEAFTSELLENLEDMWSVNYEQMTMKFVIKILHLYKVDVQL